MSRILVIDVGNSRMKWGLRGPRGWLALGVTPNSEIGALSLRDWHNLPRPARAVGVNVAGEAARVRVEAQLARWRLTPEWLTRIGVRLRRHQPLRAARAARRGPLGVARRRWRRSTATDLFPPACVVVNAGTAVTIDALDVDGVFRGGLILPGHAAHAAGARREHVGPQGAARRIPARFRTTPRTRSTPARCRRSAARSSRCAGGSMPIRRTSAAISPAAPRPKSAASRPAGGGRRQSRARRRARARRGNAMTAAAHRRPPAAAREPDVLRVHAPRRDARTARRSRLAEQVQPDKIKLLTPQQVAALGPAKVAALADVCLEWGPLPRPTARARSRSSSRSRWASCSRSGASRRPRRSGSICRRRRTGPTPSGAPPKPGRAASATCRRRQRPAALRGVARRVRHRGRREGPARRGRRSWASANARAGPRQQVVVQTLLVIRDPQAPVVARLRDLVPAYPGSEAKIGSCEKAQ